ncbi:MAG TPA: ubiquinol-cytochrome c reductase iron-sulfur subunit [Nitrospiria bacterium]|nr:ubiquinol-cytochrome c reductase iron-sulfur subunit [Nitrospiria bacterium]
MTIKIKSKVRCSDREVGEVSRVIIDPIAKSVSHIVVQTDGTERVVPIDGQAVLAEGLVQFGFPSSQMGQYPPLERGNYQQVKEVEIAGLERHLEVFPGEALVPVPTLERDLTRRAFFTNFTNAIGVVLALPLVYPVLRYLTFPMFPGYNNNWIRIGNINQVTDIDKPKQVKFEKTVKEGYLERKFQKSNWVVRMSDDVRKEIFHAKPIEYKDENGKVYWVDPPDNPVVVYSGKCPHLGCAYKWKENHKRFGKVFWCPCHLSIYDVGGKVLDGPAPRRLDVLPMRISGTGDIEIIDAEFKAGKDHMVRII